MAGAETEAALQLIPFATSMGVGGILALVVIIFWRKDSRSDASRLQQLLDTERARGDIVMQLARDITQVVRENSGINAKLCEKLDRVIDERSGHERRIGQ